MNFQIIGTGSAHPACSKTNDDLSHLMETSDEWISTRTGIRSRYVSTGETLTELAVEASRKALENAGVPADELDLIICSTIRGDYITPSEACMVQRGSGASCPAFDVNAACSGFLYSLDVAAGYFARGRVKNVLLVSAEMMSKLVNWKDRATCVLFGDGAGAVVLTQGEGFLSMKLTAQGGAEMLSIPHVEGNSPFCPTEPAPPYLLMDGHGVYRFAVASMERDILDVLAEANLTLGDVSYVLPHQANLRIIEAGRKKLGLPPERVLSNINRHGNMSSACIPTLMDESNRAGLFRRGDILVLSAFGSGLTSAACVLRW